MSAKTGIQWTDATWNPVVGCDKVSQGCKFCYAKTIHDMRHAAYLAGKKVAEQYRLPFESVQLKPDRLLYPVRWQTPMKIFVNSVSDLFHHHVPDTFIDQVMAVIVFSQRHTFQLLTKRPERARDYFVEMGNGSEASKDRWDAARLWLRNALPYKGNTLLGMREHIGVHMAHTWPAHGNTIPNLWLGTSVENQAAADERITALRSTPGVQTLWLSCEPLLGPVDVREHLWPVHPSWPAQFASPEAAVAAGAKVDYKPQALLSQAGARTLIRWIVVGGESGTKKQNVRAMHPEWARSLRQQCVSSRTPFFFKQWGDHQAGEDVDTNRLTPTTPAVYMDEDTVMYRLGARRAGRQLDGREWNEFPRAVAS